MATSGAASSADGGPRRLHPLIASTALSVTGDGMFAAGAGLLAVAITHDPVIVSLVAVATFGTRILFQLPAGVLADRWPRRSVMIAADLVRAAVVIGLIALIASGAITIAVLLAAVALVTAISCIFDPAAQAMIPEIAGQDKRELDRFNGHFWVAYSLARICRTAARVGRVRGRADVAVRRGCCLIFRERLPDPPDSAIPPGYAEAGQAAGHLRTA
ncbi:MAG: MFS transporter [Streptosporangiaceae bacterium]